MSGTYFSHYHAGLDFTSVLCRREVGFFLELFIDRVLDIALECRVDLKASGIYHTLSVFLAHSVLVHEISCNDSCNVIAEVCICVLFLLKAWGKYVYDVHIGLAGVSSRDIALISHEIQDHVTPVLGQIVSVEACPFFLFIFVFFAACIAFFFVFFRGFDFVERIIVDILYLLIAFRVFRDQGIAVRRLRKGRQSSAFRERQIAHFLGEICSGRGADTVVAVS